MFEGWLLELTPVDEIIRLRKVDSKQFWNVICWVLFRNDKLIVTDFYPVYWNYDAKCGIIMS
jgi:pantothenate kinase-related protein Tda10